MSAALLVDFVVRQTGGPALTWYQVGLIVLSAIALTFTLLVLAPFLIFFEYLFWSRLAKAGGAAAEQRSVGFEHLGPPDLGCLRSW